MAENKSVEDLTDLNRIMSDNATSNKGRVPFPDESLFIRDARLIDVYTERTRLSLEGNKSSESIIGISESDFIVVNIMIGFVDECILSIEFLIER